MTDLLVFASLPIDPAALQLSGQEDPQSWIQVAKVGHNFKKGQRTFSITEEMLDEMVANSEAVANEIPLDYNHLSLEATTPEQAISAGWFKKLERRASELWGLASWTPRAAEHIRKKEFRYISPVVLPVGLDEHGKSTGARLMSAALTIYPFLKGMAPVALNELMMNRIVLADMSLDEKRSRLSTALTDLYAADYAYVYLCDVYDDYIVFNRSGKYYKLPYSISDNWLIAFDGEPKEVVPQYEALNALPGGKQPMANEQITGTEDINALKASLATLTETVTKQKTDLDTERANVLALSEKLKKRDAEDAVAGLIKAGKLKVDQKDAWIALHMKDAETFVALSAGLTASKVKVGQEVGTGSNAEVVDDEPTAIEGEAAIAMMEEKVAKYSADHKVSAGVAMNAIGEEFPDLAKAYREAFAETR